MKADHVLQPRRAIYRWWFLAGALAVLPLTAAAVPWSKTSDFVWSPNGNVTQANIGTGSGATILDYKATGTGVTLGSSSNIPVGGTKVPLNVIVKASAANVGKAIAIVAGRALPVVGGVLLVVDVLQQAGVIVKANPDGSGHKFFELEDDGSCSGSVCQEFRNDNTRPWGSKTRACSDWASVVAGQGTYILSNVRPVPGEPKCAAEYAPVSNPSKSLGTDYHSILFRDAASSPGSKEVEITPNRAGEMLAEKIARESGWPTPDLGRAFQEAIRAGQTIDVTTPTVTGPASSTNPPVTRTTTNPQGQSITTTTNTTNNYNYAGNTVTNSPTTTTTTVNNNTGEKTEETETTKDDRTECQKNPESMACATTDVPDGDIPTNTKTVTYAPEGSLGGGSCPSDRSLGVEYTFSYSSTCSTLTTYVRPMVLAIAAWMALVIIFGIGKASE